MDRDRLFSGPFVLCSLSNLFQALAFNLFLHFPGFLKELGARETQIGLLFTMVVNRVRDADRGTAGFALADRGRR